MLDGVITTGEATWSDDLLLQLQRFGYSEECYFSFSFSPIRIETGAIGGVFTAVMETTDRLIAERRLNTLRELAARTADADSENKVFTLAAETLAKNRYDVSFSVLYLLTPDARYIEPKAWTAISSDHVLCKGRKDLGRPEPPLLSAVGDVFRSGVVCVVADLQQCCPNLPLGIWGIAPAEAIALPVVLPGHSSPLGCFFVGLNARKRLDQDYRQFLELTARQIASNLAAARAHEEERKRAEMLAELDRAKTMLFSNVSHEFRTPLTLMVGPVEAMLERALPSAIVSKEELQLVHRNAMRLLKLVNTLLDFSRIESGRVQAIYEPTDLSALTADTASAFRSAMDQAGLEFVIDCPPLAEPAYVDRDMWEKIVLNLISNAFKFTLAGGVTVRLRAVANQLELRVEDTGLGIPEAQQSKFFDRFHRVEGVRGRTHEGTGIGLALVQELARRHGGSIRVESTVGKGSTFMVSIPKGRAHLPAERLSKVQILSSAGVSASAYVDEALRWLPETAKTTESKGIALTTNEVQQFLEAAREICLEYDPLLLMAVRAGLRRGELVALQWGDIQLGADEKHSDRFILVQHNYVRREHTTTKSKKSRRVDLSRELRRVLIELRDKRLLEAYLNGKNNVSDELVFRSPGGTILDPDNLYHRVFLPVLAKAGIRKIRLHDLRHTFGSLLLQNVAAIVYVKEQMGDSSIQVTVDTYGHLIPGANVCFVDRLDEVSAELAETTPQQSATPAQQGEMKVPPDLL